MTDLFGFIAAFLTSIAFLPQLIRTFRTKSADDVSLVMLVVFIIGLLFWITYGIQVNSLPVLFANIITLGFNSAILLLKIYYRNNTIKDLNGL
ncbi:MULTISPECIES: SemiSWEET family sugar transporter [unclassified Prochlorococcus]|uniref:SemiSWEET family sugar transporter n=1 Tax=unclassified Prochlorococcus TaxID=2627481 RepID=UPI00090791B7|nr:MULTISPECIES: SemiSWEET transporter [unclassified Prochlorococcus]